MHKMARSIRLEPVPGWQVVGADSAAPILDARALPLLRGIERHGTLVAAARAAAVPYRTAWTILAEAGEALGMPLAELSPGRGALLTALAIRLISADDEARRLLASAIAPLEVQQAPARSARTASPLRVAASHDIALAQLKDRWRVAHGVQLAFHGSAQNLDAFHAGQADLAGFHVSTDVEGEDALLARLKPGRDALLRFLTRSQGLILPRGNPRRVRTLADLASKRLSIINRQAGSGTRLLFDRLLAAEGVNAEAIPGYAMEEFTHPAIAATVAAGKADAGFGIEAAAAQFGLHFVPLVTERYFFACKRRALGSSRIEAFRDLLRNPATRAVVAPLPGYALDGPGEIAPGMR